MIRAGYGSKGSLIIRSVDKYFWFHLIVWLILKYKNMMRMNLNLFCVYSRDNLPNKIRDGAHIIDLDEYSDIGTHWIVLYALNNNGTYFDSFGVEHIPKEIIKFTDRFLTKANIYKIQAYDSVMCWYFYIGFIDRLYQSWQIYQSFFTK